MDWDDIRHFVAVAELKSLSKAAHALKVTPSQVSRRITELEQRLATKLLNRTQSGVTLTAAGEDVFDMALSMQRFASSIENTARSRDLRDEGHVTIAVPDGLAAYWLAPRIGDFLNANPRIQLALECGLWAREPLRASPDLTITASLESAEVGDATEVLCALHYLFVASPKYIETYGAPTSIAAAAGDHRTLKHVAQRFQRESWDDRARAIEALSSFSVETNSSAAMVAALIGGAGIGAVPSYLLHLHPELNVIGSVQSIPIKLWLVAHQGAKNSARVKRVAEWLRGLFDTKTNPWFREEFVAPDRFAAELAAVTKRRASNR
jgi:DNA-binding transcriptional LysR family regulator